MEPITAVLFDLHTTLVDGGEPHRWLGEALAGVAARAPRDAAATEGFLARIWDHAEEIDPGFRRDLDPTAHREVFFELAQRVDDAEDLQLDPALVAELYRIMADQWQAYDDSLPVLRALRAAGVRTALVSNVGIDVRGVLERTGLAEELDAVVLSCEVGAVKPDRRIFETAMAQLGSEPAHSLMVGDSPVADVGAVAAGLRTLLLPPTAGRIRGLNSVCRLVGVPEPL